VTSYYYRKLPPKIKITVEGSILVRLMEAMKRKTRKNEDYQ
jgi:hypothetical protein